MILEAVFGRGPGARDEPSGGDGLEPEGEASEASINLLYKAYYKEMGGAGVPPDVRPRQNEQVSDNVTAFRRPQPKSAPFGSSMKSGSNKKPQLPVALIFACLLVVYVGIRYFWR